MNSIESELFDEFKYVDKICREMYNAEKGVSTYIGHMEMTPMSVKFRIPNWDNDYKQLKHIRWVRNQLAHETGYVESNIADVDWLKDFHNRLLTQQDPLACVGKIERSSKQRTAIKPQSPSVSFVAPSHGEKPKRKSVALWIVLTALGAAVAVVVVVAILAIICVNIF